jgi:hippurate hydrolase
MQEFRTRALAADRLRAAGYEVTVGVGKTGVVGLLRNGDGPTVMLRAGMVGLHILEATDLRYASDVVLGQHVLVGPAGTVAGSAGPITSAADSL